MNRPTPPDGTARPRTQIRTATATDVPALARVLAAAFDEPVTRWLVPDPGRRAPVMTAFFDLAARDALDAGHVDVLLGPDGQIHAAALWFDRTDPVGPALARLDQPIPDLRYERVFGQDARRWRILDDVMTATHPLTPHHYLLAIGVRPDLQGWGLGTRLLGAGHRGIHPYPAYLEATSSDSRRLYLRNGYLDDGHPLQIPAGPVMWPMWRSSGAHRPGAGSEVRSEVRPEAGPEAGSEVGPEAGLRDFGPRDFSPRD